MNSRAGQQVPRVRRRRTISNKSGEIAPQTEYKYRLVAQSVLWQMDGFPSAGKGSNEQQVREDGPETRKRD